MLVVIFSSQSTCRLLDLLLVHLRFFTLVFAGGCFLYDWFWCWLSIWGSITPRGADTHSNDVLFSVDTFLDLVRWDVLLLMFFVKIYGMTNHFDSLIFHWSPYKMKNGAEESNSSLFVRTSYLLSFKYNVYMSISFLESMTRFTFEVPVVS